MLMSDLANVNQIVMYSHRMSEFNENLVLRVDQLSRSEQRNKKKSHDIGTITEKLSWEVR